VASSWFFILQLSRYYSVHHVLRCTQSGSIFLPVVHLHKKGDLSTLVMKRLFLITRLYGAQHKKQHYLL